MEYEWLTVLEVEKETGIPNASLRRYLRVHGHHCNIKKKGKSYQIARESLETMNQIRKLYESGRNADQVENILTSTGTPVTIDVTEGEETVTVSASEAFEALKNEIRQANESHDQKINALQEKLDSQQEYIDKRLEERDRKLTETLREIAAARSEEKKGWFARLFKK